MLTFKINTSFLFVSVKELTINDISYLYQFSILCYKKNIVSICQCKRINHDISYLSLSIFYFYVIRKIQFRGYVVLIKKTLQNGKGGLSQRKGTHPVTFPCKYLHNSIFNPKKELEWVRRSFTGEFKKDRDDRLCWRILS